MPFLIPLVALALLVGVVVAVRHSRRTDEEWALAAKQLGLRYASKGLFGKRELRGKVDGLRVVVDTISRGTGEHNTKHTRYRVAYPSLKLGLKLKKQGFLTQVASFFGYQDIEVGDPLFDDAVIVQGDRPSQVKSFLTPYRRHHVRRALQSYPDCQISDTGIRCERGRLDKQHHSIVATVQGLLRIARALIDDVPRETALAQALEAREAGELDDALELVRSPPARTPPAASPEADVVEGQILLTAGHHEQARDAFRRALVELPEDVEVIAGARGEVLVPAHPFSQPAAPVEDEAPPAEPAGSPRAGADETDGEPAPAKDLEPDGPAPAARPTPLPAEGVDTDPLVLANALFVAGRMSSEVVRDFEERYAGRDVRWTGKLERVATFYSDLVFGSGPGTKAVVHLGEISGGAYGTRDVRAVVQLPAELEAAVRERRGEEVTFTGRLVRCDAFVRNLFVAGGSLLQ